MMKIAVTYENGNVYQHFGHTQQFCLYQVENGAVTARQIVDTDGQGHGALAGFLVRQGVEVLICGGIGGGARSALAAAGIQLYGGVSGRVEDAVQRYLRGGLAYDPAACCAHHPEGEAHACGEGHSGCTGHGGCHQ